MKFAKNRFFLVDKPVFCGILNCDWILMDEQMLFDVTFDTQEDFYGKLYEKMWEADGHCGGCDSVCVDRMCFFARRRSGTHPRGQDTKRYGRNKRI
jgi:hypothetical protein